MIEVKKLTFRVQKRTLLERVDLEIRPGECLGVIGPNGAGKSTLLKLLSGQIHPAEGRIIVDGQDLREIHPRSLARQRAVLPQHSRIPFDFTGEDLVMMGRLPHPGSSVSHRDIARAVMQRTDTWHLAERIATTLSGGELQRIHLARVLAQIWHPPAEGNRYLFLDEPTSSLDLSHQHSTLRVVREFSREGCGVLIILHDLNLAAQYTDRLLLLVNGKAQGCGSSSEILTAEHIEQAFGIEVTIQPHPLTGLPVVLPAS